MSKILKILTNGRVISAVISALGAIVSACCAGCRLYCGEMAISKLECDIFSPYHSMTNKVN